MNFKSILKWHNPQHKATCTRMLYQTMLYVVIFLLIRHTGCFHLFTIMNHASPCFLVYVSYQKQRFQITLHSACTNVFILIGPYCTLPTFDNVQEISLTFANLMGMKWHFKVALSFHVPDDSEAKQLFMHLWAMGQWISLLISKLVWTPILNLRI